ncbi:uncharacterized protein BP5553_04957 [Venustampulla echinocandica]|uniref:ArfGap-domain-containing protein n=1 Tax=Venustampulla echinocandica TaxID=2656787 RepID=A0A370TPS7_9HELO|nr:uncharacterized protein BP5553_04957 [Venustampulla echinocandica]RDL37524.1 hypothetical protein BP5553_04957 [Venustampulla echinocandica]
MSGALSKRQQARNERTLQDLLKSVPGNNVCADCQARNPGWASWSLGIFLCMRCAALHRKMGTHITKVKSLSMDSWSNEQVENMKRVGNVASNRTYNPKNSRPPIPIDADEADSAMERFIRQKYQETVVQAPVRHNTGRSTGSDEPPPLPPKTGGRFGFRSASSIFPLSSKSKQNAAPTHFDSAHRRSPSPPRSKPSRVFGASMAHEAQDDLDGKLSTLRDMGFKDEHRNVAVLKGLSGNLEKSIETLVRLGEGNGSGGGAKAGDTSGPSSGSRPPIRPTAGISIGRAREKSPPRASTNPFDMLDALPPPPPAKPQASQAAEFKALPQSPIAGNNPFQQASNSNPFGLMPSQSQVNLTQTFQNMDISSSQPLFPNHTGGFPGPSPQQPQHQQLYQQSMTPPVPSLPQQYYPPIIYENSAQQQQQQVQSSNYNPFLQQQQSVQAPTLNTNFQSNPFLKRSLPGTPSYYQSPVEQSPQQPSMVSSYYGQQNQPQTGSNPFLQGNQFPQQPQQHQGYQQQQQQQYQQFPQQTHPLLSQQTARPDKRSILDLYNFPQLAPTPVQQQQQQQDPGQAQYPPSNPAAAVPQQQVLSASNPLAAQIAGNRNPFMTNGGGGGGAQSPGAESGGNMAPFPPPNGARHISRESVNIDIGGWQNGRHSPDAWGTISARSMR